MSLRERALNVAAFVWGVAEATLFFFVPDVLLSYIGLRRGARAAGVASLCAALGAGVGGGAMYLWSANDPDGAYAAVLAVPAISVAMAEAAAADMAAQGWFAATFAGPLSSTPFKLYAILAPQAGAGLASFAAASALLRLPRFLVVSIGVALLGRWLEPRLGAQRLVWALAAAWVVFYAAFLTLMPN